MTFMRITHRTEWFNLSKLENAELELRYLSIRLNSSNVSLHYFLITPSYWILRSPVDGNKHEKTKLYRSPRCKSHLLLLAPLESYGEKLFERKFKLPWSNPRSILGDKLFGRKFDKPWSKPNRCSRRRRPSRRDLHLPLWNSLLIRAFCKFSDRKSVV